MNIQDLPTEHTYVAVTGQTEFSFGFRTFGLGNVAVQVNGVSLTYSPDADSFTEFSVTTDPDAHGGFVTIGAPLVGGERVVVYRQLPIERITQFPDSGPVPNNDLNLEFNRTVGTLQDIAARARRTPGFAPGEVVPSFLSLAGKAGQALVVVGEGEQQRIGTATTDAAELADLLYTASVSALAAANAYASSLEQVALASAQRVGAENARDLAEVYASQAFTAAQSAEGVYTSDYISAVPQGVSSITIGSAGTGFADGTYAGGVSGGPTGFAFTYTASGGGVTEVDIVFAGLSPSDAVPTLSFPNGGGSGAAATATVGDLVSEQGTYFAIAVDGHTLLLTRNNGGAAAAVLDGDGTQVSLLNTKGMREIVRRLSIFADTTIANTYPALLRILPGMSIEGLDLTESYRLKSFWRDAVSGGRFQLIITRNSDNVDVLGVGRSGSSLNPSGFAGVRVIELVALNGSGAFGSVPVDFTDGSLFGSNAVSFTAAEGTLRLDTVSLTQSKLSVIDARARAIVDAAADVPVEMTLALDSYLRSIVRFVRIAGLDPDDKPFINYEMEAYLGIPLYRVRIELWSEKLGAIVARWSRQSATDVFPDIPDQIYLTNRVDGFVFGTDYGVTAMMGLNVENFSYGKAMTAHRTAAQTGIRQRAIITAMENERQWVSGIVSPERHLRIGATNGDYPFLHLATQALEDPSKASTITRSTYPSNDLIGTEYPAIFEFVDPVSENVPAFTYASILQSELRLPMGSIVRTRDDTDIYMDAAGTAPTVEAPHTFRVEGGGKWRRNGGVGANGYIFHIDAAGAFNGRFAGMQGRRLQSIIHGGILEVDADHNAPLIGAGIGDEHIMLIDEVQFVVPSDSTRTERIIVCHGSPNSVMAGTLHVRNCTSNDQAIISPGSIDFIQVIKSTAGAHRHRLIVENTRAGPIAYTNSFADGIPGWVLVGDASGLPYDPELDL